MSGNNAPPVLYNKISNSIKNLDVFPKRFKIMESAPEQEMERHRFQVDNYTVFFTIQKDCVIVTAYCIALLTSAID